MAFNALAGAAMIAVENTAALRTLAAFFGFSGL